MPQIEKAVDIHCVTRWTKLGARFRGVPLSHILAKAGVLPQARFISFIARSDRSHSTSLSLKDASGLDVLIALEYEGLLLEEALPPPGGGAVPTTPADHAAPAHPASVVLLAGSASTGIMPMIGLPKRRTPEQSRR